MGAPVVTTGAMAMCSFGLAPSSLAALPVRRVLVEGKPPLCTPDIAPAVNIPPFAMCQSPANPTVAAATIAALGVLTPMPCVPMVAGPWMPGAAKTVIGGMPALTAGSTCTCTWGGMISITFAGSLKSMAG
ncbi:MAG: hypothetical protein JWM47_1399 [Acidimicrobiales bacterium]|nr:hypothetical protein [Acidimicrobiales bacterium]